MKYFTVHDENGRVLRTGYCHEKDFAGQATHAGESVVEGQADGRRHKVVDGKIVDKPEDKPLPVPYTFSRAQEYPPLADFADAYYWMVKGDQSKMDTYIAKVDAVKSKYPKPSGK